MGYPCRVYTVIPWFAARRARKSLWQMLQLALTDRPTLLAVLRDKYTSEDKLRPFAPLAERFGGRLHVIVAAEWEQDDREREGEAALRELGVAPEVRPRLLRDDGRRRFALLLRQKQAEAAVPYLQQAADKKPKEYRPRFYLAEALLAAGDSSKAEENYKARAHTTLDGRPDPRGEEIAAREDEVARKIDELLVRLPPPAPPPTRMLQPGEHDFSPQGLCRLCGQGRATLVACAGTKRDEGLRRDRFELIELD